MLWIGIDPGLSGGVAFIHPDGIAQAFPMPLAGGEIDVAAVLSDLRNLATFDERTWLVTMEKAQAMPKQGVTSVFTYGMGYGSLRGALAARAIRCELVRPTDWKREVLAGTDKDKDAAIAYVTRCFPDTDLRATPRSRKLHDGMADAICIAEYGRRRFKNG